MYFDQQQVVCMPFAVSTGVVTKKGLHKCMFHLFLALFLFVTEKEVKMLKRHAKHPFAGQNIQQTNLMPNILQCKY